jgi:sugar phosphate permease
VAFNGLWAIPYLTQVYGVSRVEATTYTSAVALGVIAGSPLAGWISDRWLRRRRPPFIAFALLYALAWAALALPAPGRLGLPAVLAVCFGLGLGAGCMALPFACVREVNRPADAGLAIGFPNGLAFLGIGLAQWGLGAVLDARWLGVLAGGARVYPPAAYQAAFGVCLLVAVLALLATCLVTETRGRARAS